MLGTPIKFRTAPETIAAPPRLGEHTDELLRGLLGYADATIEALRREGVV